MPRINGDEECSDPSRVDSTRLDEQALADHFDSIHRRLVSYARFQLGSYPESILSPSDVVQDACLKAWRKVDRFQGVSARELYRWLRPFVRFEALNARRLARRRVIGVNLENEALDSLPSDREGPVTAAAREELHQSLQEALARVTENQRRLIQLVFFEGVTIRRAANLLGVDAESGVYKLLRRGLLRLYRELSGV